MKRWTCPKCGQIIIGIARSPMHPLKYSEKRITSGYPPEDKTKEVICPKCLHEF